MTDAEITARVEARTRAGDCIGLMAGEAEQLGDDARKVFWEFVRDFALRQECLEEIEIAGGTFGDAWEATKSRGWRCFQDDDEEWQRRCPDCGGI